MNGTRLIATVCVAFSMTQVAQALDATSANALATSVLSQLGRSKGFCAVPNCGNGQLALSFLQLSGMKVHAMDAADANVAAARSLALGAGFVAPQFYCDKGSLSAMPYAARFVDCIVITNITDADLASIPYAEIERALCPAGMAWIGRATSEGAGVTQTALQNWINAASKARSTAVVSTNLGTWAVITGQELRGVDVWVRHNYDASGIKYSKDSVAAFPWLPQAKIKPYRKNSGGGTVVTSGGRMYYVSVDQLSNGTTAQWLRAYSIYNGELLWTRNVGSDNLGDLSGNATMIAYQNDLYINRGGTYTRLSGLTGADLGTAATVPSDPADNIAMPTTGNINGCPPRSASINATYGSTAVYGWDFLDNIQRAGHFYKPPCGDIGTIQSNGFHINAAPTCICGSSRMQGTHVDATDRTFQFDRSAPTDGSGRLEQGPAFGDMSPQIVPDSLDWAMHRSTVSHSGRTLVQVPSTAPALMWNWAPAHNYVTVRTSMAYDYLPEQEPTPPVVVAGHTFFGGTDGYVRCIDNGTGLVDWSYATGGRIYATPTIAAGCVYVGSGDGFAYCIEAHTGRLVWRYRAAPVDRRFNLYGHLSSMWPVLSGVLVYNGNAFFAAGLQSEYGSHLYCVNARTGALVWQNNSGATWLNSLDRLGYTPCGYLTVGRNRLIAANSVAGNATFNLTTGAMDALPALGNIGLMRNGYPAIGVSRGREVGVINDTWLVRGARLMFSDHNTRYFIGWWPTPNFIGFNQLDASGTSTYPSVALNSVTMVAPAWDASVYYQCTYSGTLGLRQFSLSALTAALTSERAANADAGWGLARGAPFQGEVDASDPQAWWPATNWVRSDINVSALASAPNGLVALYCKSATSGRIPIPEAVAWYLGVLNRSSGATIWEAQLPNVGTNLAGEPLFEGLAVDRNGYIIVAQRNGNMLCYGNGTVSVALPEPAKAAPAMAFPAPDQTPAALAALEAVGRPPRPSGARASCAVTSAPASDLIWPDYALLAAADKSDLVTQTDGALVHLMSPVERIARAEERARIADNRWKPQTACLSVASVSASSLSARAHAAANTLDRDLRTRWSPAGAGTQWLAYDLGAVREVSSASIVWFGRSRQSIPFTVEFSVDGKEYHVVDNGTLGGQGAAESLRRFVPQDARYVRIVFTLKQGGSLPAVQEVGIHGGEALAGDRSAGVVTSAQAD